MIPIIISIILSVLSCIAIFLLKTSTSLNLSDGEFVNSTIAIFACLGGLISATFVIYSYIQTNRAFIISLKPALLIQVKSKLVQTNQNVQSISQTFIHYTNTSNNEFENLTIILKLKVGNREIDLSDLFKPNMFMAAHDQRHRIVETLKELSNRGIDINSETKAGNAVILSTGYKYIFNRKIEQRLGAEYKWNAQIQHWEIL